MKLTIQNLYDSGSTALLRSILDDMNISYNKDIHLGQLVMNTFLPAEKIAHLESKLAEHGLAILYERKQVLSEQVKYIVMDMLKSTEPPTENYSNYISARLNLNYTYLANVFSEAQGITIEHFIINQKIEKAKMMLLYEEYSIGQIAALLHYSSIGHLSNQFKKVTGMNPSDFKKKAKKATFQ
jgi:YesN/AraC family two-component response regulator